MKICGYSQIDSEKEGKSTHGIMVHRTISLTRSGSGGIKSVSTWLSDSLLQASGLTRVDIIDCYIGQKELILESYTENGYTNVASIMIL